MGLFALFSNRLTRRLYTRLFQASTQHLQPAPLSPSRLEKRRVLDAGMAELLLGSAAAAGDYVQAGGVQAGENPAAVEGEVDGENTAPSNLQLFLGADSIDESEVLQLALTFDDPDPADTHTAIIDWGDGTTPEVFTIDPGARFLGTSHQYLDDNPTATPVDPNTITVTIIDAAGECDSASADVMVFNIDPTIDTLSITTPIKEGEFATLTGTYSDPGTQDTFELDIDWDGDGAYDETITVSGGEFEVSRQFLDDNPSGTLTDTFDVNVRLRDDDGGFDTDSVELTVEDLSPINVQIEPISMIDENGFVTTRVTFEDGGILDTHFASINWGDGSDLERVDIEPGERSLIITHQYLDDDPTGTPADSYLIRVGIINDDLGRSVPRATAEVLVKNVNPVLTVTDRMVDEGELLDLTGGGLGSFTDVGTRDTHTATVNWGDGSPTETAVVNQGNGFGTLDGSHTYADDGVYTVTVTVTDDDGGTTIEQFEVTVKNVAPELTLDPIAMINENGEATLTGSISDPGVLDTFTLEITWGDPLSPDNVQSFALGDVALTAADDGIDWDPVSRTFSVTHQYLDDNPSVTSSDNYTVSVIVTDDDSGQDLGAQEVLVKNVAPELTLNPIVMIDENGEATLTGSISDPGILDTFTLEITWGDPLSPDNVQSFALGDVALTSAVDGIDWDPVTGTFSITHRYLDDNPTATSSDSYTVGVNLSDDDSGEDLASETVVVKNVPPIVTLEPVAPISENGTATLSGSISDPGSLETFTLDIDWGDPLSPDNVQSFALGDVALTKAVDGINWDPVTRAFSVTHQYLDDNPSVMPSDTYTINVLVTDDDTGEGSTSETVLIENVPPIVTLDPISMINENGEATLSGSVIDAGSLDTFTLEIDWGDSLSPNNVQSFALGNVALTEAMDGINWDPVTRTFSLNHQYLDDNPSVTSSDNYTVAVNITDDDSSVAEASELVLIKNVAPELTLNPIVMINENGEATLTGSISDPGILDTFTLDITWGDPLSPNNVQSFVLGDVALTAADDGIDWDPESRTFSIAHQYLDDNPSATSSDTYVVSVVVTDDDSGIDSGMQEVLVKNVAAELTLDPIAMIDENGEATLTGSISDPGSLDTFFLGISWGDSGPDNAQSFVLGHVVLTEAVDGIDWDPVTRTFSVTHQYLDDNPTATSSDSYTVDVVVSDDDSGEDIGAQEVLVKNVAPELTLDPVTMINENGEATLTGSISDVGSLDTFTLNIDWGDPLSPDNVQSFALGDVALTSADDGIDWDPVSRTFSVTHQYLDDNPSVTSSDNYTVSVVVTDDDSGQDLGAQEVLVKNVAPELTLDPIAMIDENGEATLSGTISDPGSLDTFILDITWGDPLSPNNVQSFALGSTPLTAAVDGINWDPVTRTFSLTHRYLDDNPTVTPGDFYQIDVVVTDDDNGQDSEMVFVEIRNGGPILALAEVADILENDTAVLTGAFSDRSVLDPHRVTIDWDDQNNALDSVFDVPPIQMIDLETGNLTQVLFAGDEFLSTTPGDATKLLITSVNPETGTIEFLVTHQYLDDGVAGTAAPGANGTLFDVSSIQVTVADDDGGTITAETTVKVSNIDPVIEELSIDKDSIYENDPPVTIHGTFSDIGSLDFHSIRIDWADGTVVDTDLSTDAPSDQLVFVQDSPGSGTFYATHKYVDNDRDGTLDNNYTIVVTLTDDDGGEHIRYLDLEVLNHNPVLQEIEQEDATEVNTAGETFVTITFSEIGEDELTIWVDWGDLRDPNDPFERAEDPFVKETPISIVGPTDGPGMYTVTLMHTYTGPPNPLSPAADIEIFVVVVDDDFDRALAGGQFEAPKELQPVEEPGSSEIQMVTITNQGTGVTPIVIDTTPQVPRLTFPPPDEGMFFVGASSTGEGVSQGADLRTAVGDTKAAAESYLELRVLDPFTGEPSEAIRLKPEVLKDLPGFFQTLPDNRYAIYLIRTETNTERLVIEVYVRNGKVIDPGDDSEGTRDRPPTDEETEERQLDRANEEASEEQLQEGPQLNPAEASVDMPQETLVRSKWSSQRRSRMLATSAILGLVASQSGSSWAQRVDQSVASANPQMWRRLRRRPPSRPK